jgi:hypothetical protein
VRRLLYRWTSGRSARFSLRTYDECVNDGDGTLVAHTVVHSPSLWNTVDYRYGVGPLGKAVS